MRRSLWWPCKLIQGDKIKYDGKTYQVLSQSASRQDSAFFKARFYTFVIELQK